MLFGSALIMIRLFECYFWVQVVMKSKIIASDKDSVGIVFFGAVSYHCSHRSELYDINIVYLLMQESQNSSEYGCEHTNVCNFIPLGPPSAERILAVQVSGR